MNFITSLSNVIKIKMQQIFIYFVESIIYDISYFIGSYKYYLIPLGQIGNILNKFNILTLLKLLHIGWMYSYMIASNDILQKRKIPFILKILPYWLKVCHLFHDWLRSLKKKWLFFELHRREGGMKGIWCIS